MNRNIRSTTGLLLMAAVAVILTNVARSQSSQQQPSQMPPANDGAAVGQDESAPPEPPATRSELNALLEQGRKALAESRFDDAEASLRVAERSAVRYPRLYFGDTPTKLRRDLNAATAKRGAERPRFDALASLLGGAKRPVSDPFIKPQNPADDLGRQLTGTSNPFRENAAGRLFEAAPMNNDGDLSPRESSDRAIVGARQALTVGDRARAQQYLALAQQLGVAYDANGDSPDAVARAIGELQQIEELKNRDDDRLAWRQAYARFLVDQAEALIGWNDLETASRAAGEAAQLGAEFVAGSTTPKDLQRRIAQLRESDAAIAESDAAVPQETESQTTPSPYESTPYGVDPSTLLTGQLQAPLMQDNQVQPAGGELLPFEAELAGGEPETDEDNVRLSQAPIPLPLPAVDEITLPAPPRNDGPSEKPADAPSETPVDTSEAVQQGEAALRSGDRAEALRLFQAAFKRKDELDLLTQQRLQGHLQMLSTGSQAPTPTQPGEDSEFLSAAGDSQTVLARQIFNDVTKRQAEAGRVRESDPYRSQQILEEARNLVDKSGLDGDTKAQLISRVNLSVDATAKYIADNKAQLDLDAANQAVLDELDRERTVKVQVQEKVAELVDQFNKLIDEHRDAEAEVIAKQLYEIAPDELVVQQVNLQAKMLRRQRRSSAINRDAEDGFANFSLDARETAAEAAQGMTRDYQFGKNWADIVGRTGSSEKRSRRSARELEIEKKLKTNVLPTYNETPLSVVIESLGDLTDINIHLDPLGMSQEGVRSDTPITLNLKREISLKSALQLILEPLHLTHQIKDEVLKITSEQIRDGETYIETYNVADLVIPIPNFVPSSNIGLQGLIEDAYHSMGYGAGMSGGGIGLVKHSRPGDPAGAVGERVLANPMAGAGGAGGGATPFGTLGTGGPGGAAAADFDSLIDLIISTVEHESWMENGTGEGEIQPFPTNLSLVVSQTQRVHEQIVDLLEQLRRLQDLQVTIEVRFIRLDDSFFERIGIDFDFNIEDGTGIATNPGIPGNLSPGSSFEGNRASAAVGITNPPADGFFPNFTADLDIPFRNESFGLATPAFGNAQSVGTFGFSVLSDIEAFFVIEASQGDQRNNVLQAPKVTLFNGQQATVLDTAFTPFVISVIPVVGEFAAAQQPVIVVLSEGTMMTVQAVVSDDRRYVRLTLVPFFSQIGEVREFTFDGSETVQNSSNTTDNDDDGNNENDNNAQQTIRSGTTVQLPTFEVISVSTTVSVPDGGTVLLGGIKRLREGRNEFGVPLLSKIPYVDRLFRNVGIGRETDSLMMMVTPHIIIQEEEEERLGINNE